MSYFINENAHYLHRIDKFWLGGELKEEQVQYSIHVKLAPKFYKTGTIAFVYNDTIFNKHTQTLYFTIFGQRIKRHWWLYYYVNVLCK